MADSDAGSRIQGRDERDAFAILQVTRQLGPEGARTAAEQALIALAAGDVDPAAAPTLSGIVADYPDAQALFEEHTTVLSQVRAAVLPTASRVSRLTTALRQISQRETGMPDPNDPGHPPSGPPGALDVQRGTAASVPEWEDSEEPAADLTEEEEATLAEAMQGVERAVRDLFSALAPYDPASETQDAAGQLMLAYVAGDLSAEAEHVVQVLIPDYPLASAMELEFCSLLGRTRESMLSRKPVTPREREGPPGDHATGEIAEDEETDSLIGAVVSRILDGDLPLASAILHLGYGPRTPRTVSREEIADRVRARTGQSDEDTQETILAFLDEVSQEVQRGNRLDVADFRPLIDPGLTDSNALAWGMRDPLTGLPNREAFSRIFESACDRAASSNLTVAMLMLDMDHFKRVNDYYGHSFGDQVITAVARLVREEADPGIAVARFGGEELVLAAVGLDAHEVTELADRIVRRMRECEWPGTQEGFAITCSIGAAIHRPGTPSEETPTPDWFFRRADEALLQVKTKGRDGYALWGS